MEKGHRERKANHIHSPKPGEKATQWKKKVTVLRLIYDSSLGMTEIQTETNLSINRIVLCSVTRS